MSSILDALEKSERERNHDAVPQYHNMQPPEEKSRRWLWLLLAIALVLLLLAVFFAARYWTPLSQQNGIANPASNAASTKQSNTGAPTVVENTPGVVYDYSNLPQTEQDALPQLRINVVSVSADPKRSFVMLGEKLYREGDTVAQGTRLVTIQKDHVVMSHNGKLIRRGL